MLHCVMLKFSPVQTSLLVSYTVLHYIKYGVQSEHLSQYMHHGNMPI